MNARLANCGQPVEPQPEVLTVGGEHLGVGGQRNFMSLATHRRDEGAPAEGDPAHAGEPGADRRPGEVRIGRGAVVPGTGPEVRENPRPQIESVLGHPVTQHIEIPGPGTVRGVGRLPDPVRAPRVLLVRAVVERERKVGMVAEADVGEPGSGVVVGPDAQREMVVRNSESSAVPVDAGLEQGDSEAEGPQQGREGAAQFIAEAPRRAPTTLSRSVSSSSTVSSPRWIDRFSKGTAVRCRTCRSRRAAASGRAGRTAPMRSR